MEQWRMRYREGMRKTERVSQEKDDGVSFRPRKYLYGNLQLFGKKTGDRVQNEQKRGGRMDEG